jgi:hypothetical protein
MVPLAGIEPALLAELDFEFGAMDIPGVSDLSGCTRKTLCAIGFRSIIFPDVIVRLLFGADMVPT